MALQKRSTNVSGPMLLLIIILADVGLVVIGWHIHEQRKAEYTLAGLNLAAPPNPRTYAPPAPPPPPPPAAPAVGSGPPASVIPGKAERQAPPVRSEGASRPGPGSWMDKAEDAYYQLKKSQRFKNSKVISDWKREFLSHPDLAAIDARYRRDGDGARFLKGMVRSGNFRQMLGRYLAVPDMQAFIKELAAKPAVMAAGRTVLDDQAVMDTVKSIQIPGLPPVSRMMDLGKEIESAGARNTSDAIDKMRKNPALQQMLQEQGLSSETLQNAQTGKR